MPSDRPVSIVVWRDAKKEPPQRHIDPYGAAAPSNVLRVRKPSFVVLAYPEDEQLDNPKWYPIYDDTEVLDDLTDAWAFPPVPPSEDALTLDHLKNAADACAVLAVLRKDHEPAFGDAERAVRRAIEAAGRNTD